MKKSGKENVPTEPTRLVNFTLPEDHVEEHGRPKKIIPKTKTIHKNVAKHVPQNPTVKIEPDDMVKEQIAPDEKYLQISPEPKPEHEEPFQ